MNEHTPGPWVIERRGTNYPDLFTYDVIAPEGYRDDIGNVKRCAVACGLDSEPDARLIASALPALEVLERIINRATAPMSDGGISFEDVEAARAVIAQARA